MEEEYIAEMLQRAQSTAMKNAGEAYKTAGLSANEYMATVTSFAASLKQSTKNEEEAAKSANQAVIDMADNANKMGTNMQDIQNAYQGFAKQNYTMLDNLKLGYGGTKEEMERETMSYFCSQKKRLYLASLFFTSFCIQFIYPFSNHK